MVSRQFAQTLDRQTAIMPPIHEVVDSSNISDLSKETSATFVPGYAFNCVCY